MYAYDDTGKLLYEDGGDWILAALGQINQNRRAYGAEPQRRYVSGSIEYTYVSENIGRFGQNLHVLADFYAHTNWVDGADRGGCFETWSQQGYVPEGMARTDVWDEQPGYGQIFSGTVNDPLEVLAQDGTPYTHAYWAKDSAKDAGGKKEVDGARQKQLAANGQYFWQAQIYNPDDIHEKTHKPADTNANNANAAANKGVFGTDYITDTGTPPVEGQRIYVRRLIATQYELAMSLAIEHTVREIKRFYAEAAPVQVRDGLTLGDVLKMDAGSLGRIITYTYPDKTVPYGD